jgi:hypothetical protein
VVVPHEEGGVGGGERESAESRSMRKYKIKIFLVALLYKLDAT